MKYLLTVLLLSTLSSMKAQDRMVQENSLRPSAVQSAFPSKKEIAMREKVARTPKTTVDLQKEYYERVEAVMKARKKMARQMQKPQYADPLYFGHKRKPKKHSPRNMRFCKECGIRH